MPTPPRRRPSGVRPRAVEPTVDGMLEGGIGAYRVLRTLGRGGLCDVVLATREPGTLRAIKVLSSHHVAEGRLNPMMEWEARVLRAVCDPHVVPLLDLVPPDRFPAGGGTPALVLRHVPGVTLSELTNKYADFFFEDLAALNIVPARCYPRATEHIDNIVQVTKPR